MMWRLYVAPVLLLWLWLVTVSCGSEKAILPGEELLQDLGSAVTSDVPSCQTPDCRDGTSRNNSATGVAGNEETDAERSATDAGLPAPEDTKMAAYATTEKNSPAKEEVRGGAQNISVSPPQPAAPQTMPASAMATERTSAVNKGSSVSAVPARFSGNRNATATASTSSATPATVQRTRTTPSIETNYRNSSNIMHYLSSTPETTPSSAKQPVRTPTSQPGEPETERPPRPPVHHVEGLPVFVLNPRNRTVEFGDEVTFRCRVQSTLDVRITWEYNGMPVGQMPHWTVKERPMASTIKIKGASLEHGGRYRCLARTAVGTAASQIGFLIVEMAPTFIVEPGNHNVPYGTLLNLTCKVQAYPKPLSSWWRGQEALPEWINHDSIVVNVTKTADYSCLYKNEVGGKPKLVGRHGRVTIIGDRPDYCAVYNGAVCRDQLPSARLLFVNGNDEEPQILATKLQEIFVSPSMTELSDTCKSGLRELLCHGTHPDCYMSNGRSYGRPICRRDCQKVQDSCEAWSTLVNSNFNVLTNKIRILGLTSCQDLPDVGCTQLWQDTTTPSTTEGTVPSSSSPLGHPTTLRLQTQRRPSTIEEDQAREPTGGNPNILLILVISIPASIVLLIVLSAVGFGIKRYRYSSLYRLPKDIDLSGMKDNPMYGKDFKKSFNPHLAFLEYDRNRVIFEKDIGEGAFGRVFKATAPKLVDSETESTVAVKVLKGTADRAVTEYFNREAQMISMFNHENIIKLMGVCFVGKPPCLLLEYMSEGDLEDFLHTKSPHQANSRTNPGDGLKTHHKLNMAKQVASGMVYLNERRFVHRDIATRNCLVNSSMVVKISDFGLARYLGHKESFFGHKEEHIPIRWTAPEALWDYQFTFASDAWSYGILVWELFSYAEQPYPNLSHEDVFLHTRQGHRLACPDKTPPKAYELMSKCWHEDPTNRPRFTQVHSSIADMECEWLANGEES